MSLVSRISGKVGHAVRFFLLRRLPTCKEMVALMSESLERPLTLRERAVLRAHLWICIWCEWYLRQIEGLRSAGRARGEREPTEAAPALSDEARERIRRALEREAR
jgi:hypothetical protein